MDCRASAPAPPGFVEVSQSSPQQLSPPINNTTMVVQTPTAVLPNFGPDSQIYVCPYCHHNISTRVRTKATTKTHLIALCLCLCLCWLCCCCPYCINSCKATNHYCPNCDAFLGTYHS